ncbi:ATP synthase F1 subunit epsilon [Candidatus Gottesmanbacteria bacterium]|nr:ATP synthase F1 subunit epsilon [Candidatus Gottesmanbacteria bacterium]
MNSFHFEIITPGGIAFEDDVDMVTAPASEGVVGILPHHAPFFSSLKEGEIIIKKGSDEFSLSLGGGFITVTPEKTTILVTKAVHADELNAESVEKAKKAAEEALKNKPQGEELRAAQSILRSSLVDLEILRKIQVKRSAKGRF